MAVVTDAEVRTALRWLADLGADYRGEVPTRIHSSHHGQQYGLGSAPPFAPEFVSYIGKIGCKNPNCRQCKEDVPAYIDDRKLKSERTRVTKFFRKLRRVAPVEFDVLYMAVVYRMNAQDIANRLTERAIANGYPERYDLEAITVLTVSGVDKATYWL